VWVGNSFGGTLAKINIHTKETTLVSLPDPEAHQPYQVTVDSKHNVWTHLWSSDLVAKYDQNTSKWTLFDLPTRGTETRHISVLEREGQPIQIVVPYNRTRKIGVMTPRTEAEIAALKAQVAR
jgi:streptogramin lyase